MKNKILKIAIVGKTNAGKSSLINRIVGEKISIQNKKINTTQDLILGIKNINESQLLFYDTPGSNFINIINKKSKILKTNFWNGINKSDLILYLIDSNKINFNFLFNQLDKLKDIDKKIIIVFNKIDLISSKKLFPIIKDIESKYKIEFFFSISAKKNTGIKKLLEEITKYSYKSEWIFNKDEITNKDDKFIINELLRETILEYLHKEIPYNINLEVTVFKTLKNKDIKIKQNIIINEIRYKKIILGKKGEMIKKIREACQKKISQIFNSKIHLYLEIIKK